MISFGNHAFFLKSDFCLRGKVEEIATKLPVCFNMGKGHLFLIFRDESDLLDEGGKKGGCLFPLQEWRSVLVRICLFPAEAKDQRLRVGRQNGFNQFKDILRR